MANVLENIDRNIAQLSIVPGCEALGMAPTQNGEQEGEKEGQEGWEAGT